MTAQTGDTPADPPSPLAGQYPGHYPGPQPHHSPHQPPDHSPDHSPGQPPGQPPVYGDVPRYGYQQAGAVTQPPSPPYPPPSTGHAAFVPPYQPENQSPWQQSPYQQPPDQQPLLGAPSGASDYPAHQGYAGYAAYAGYPVPTYAYSPWLRRVGAYLIDFLPGLIAAIPFYVGYFVWVFSLAAQSDLEPYEVPDLTAGLGWMAVGSLLMLAALGWQIYNRWLVAGRTGQSLGKRVLKITLVAEATGRPIGPLNAFLRDLLHILDGMAYVGYLWPLWDDKRQTFADKLMKTVVHDAPQPPTEPPT